MDVLRAASSHAFLVQQFVAADKTPHFYQAITINTSATGSVHQETKDLSAKEVHDFIRDSPPEDSVSFFRLISFDSENGLVMCVTRDLFNDVFSTFGIDEYCKFLICKRAVCFHMSRRQGALQTFYLGLKSCRVIYTYHLPTRSTNAIVIQDRDVSPTTNPLTNLPIQIRQSANLAIHPCFLPCVSAVALLLFVRDALKHVLGGIVVFGRSLGVDVWTSNVLSHDLTTTEQLLKLGNMMDLMEPVLGELDYIRRFITVVHQLLDGMASDDVRSLLSSMDKDPLLQKADDEVREVMKIAHNQIDAEDKVMSYWMERGKNQISMVSLKFQYICFVETDVHSRFLTWSIEAMYWPASSLPRPLPGIARL